MTALKISLIKDENGVLKPSQPIPSDAVEAQSDGMHLMVYFNRDDIPQRVEPLDANQAIYAQINELEESTKFSRAQREAILSGSLAEVEVKISELRKQLK